MQLDVTLPGLRPLTLKNPVMPASGTFGSGLEFAPYGDLTRLGAIVVKGLSLKPRPGNPVPRVAETPCGMLNAIGLQNDGVEAFIRRTLPRLPWRETPVIVNLYATDLTEFAALADMLAHEEAVAGLEVNISCPNVKAGGVIFGQDPSLAASVTSAVCAVARNKHVMVKLSPNVADIAPIARAVESAGADSISCINTLTGMAVDMRTRRPLLANMVGGLSGPAIKPVALRCVWQVAQAVRIPVVGIGGITRAEDVLEFILVGATAVQIGTANFIRPDACFDIIDALPAACVRLGVDSLDGLRGALRV